MRKTSAPIARSKQIVITGYGLRYLIFTLTMFALIVSSPVAISEQHQRARYAIGQVPSDAMISQWDIAIGPDGDELPQGQGTVADGRLVYAQQCAACHGVTGVEGPDPALVGGHGSLASEQPVLTIGSYWPYPTTLFDYIYRAMPFVAPGSLSAEAVYALCAFLLHANGIVSEDVVMDQDTLPAVRMPNRDGFDPDPRPEAVLGVSTTQ
jgi:cytochrome c